MGEKRPFESRLGLLLYFLSGVLLVAGLLGTWLARDRDLAGPAVASVLMALLGGAGFLLPGLLRKNRALPEALRRFVQGKFGLLLPLACVLVLAGFFLIIEPGPELALALAPLLVAAWLAGAGISMLAGRQPQGPKEARPVQTGWVVVATAALLYGLLLIPARIPGLLDGIPWDTPLEFALALFGIPLALILGGRLFARRWAVIPLLFVLMFKLAAMLLLPQSGLVAWAYKDEAAFKAGRWERSYASFFQGAYTQVITAPFNRLREFPIEWINDRFGYDTENFQLVLELNGYAQLDGGERLAFLVEGARQAQLELVDLETAAVYPLTVNSSVNRLTGSAPGVDRQPQTMQIRGVLVFDRFGQARLQPVIIDASGSVHPALEALKIWPSLEAAQIPAARTTVFRLLLAGSDLVFLGVLLLCSLLGTYLLWKEGRLAAHEVYFAVSGLPAFLAAQLVPKPQFNLLAIAVLLLVASLILIADLSTQRTLSGFAFLVGTGVVLLSLFLTVDLQNLRSVTSFPQWQDGIEYQTFARKIYLEGDVFLENTPPRAYKVLFPYIAGAVHVLFGQSTAAQLFLSAWCAVLSGYFILRLSEHLNIAAPAAYTVAVYYLAILCTPLLYIIYFRFGLIEPFATVLLLVTMTLATQRRFVLMTITGMTTVLLRLDYLFLAMAAILLSARQITGALRPAWQHLLAWIAPSWKALARYVAILCAPPALIILAYFLFVPGYYLNASDTQQRSLASMLESMARVILGGTWPELARSFAAAPLNSILITAPLALGFTLAMAVLCIRRGVFSWIDLRLAILIPAILPAYLLVRPAAYFPRFSLPLLPLELMLIALVLQYGIKQPRLTTERK
jgi:hypothetical protein